MKNVVIIGLLLLLLLGACSVPPGDQVCINREQCISKMNDTFCFDSTDAVKRDIIIDAVRSNP